MPNLNQEFKPAIGGWVQMDKGYQISEARLRFPVDAGISMQVQTNPDTLLFFIAKDLVKGIENLERFRNYRKIEYVPRKRDFGGRGPCCDQMRLPAGTPVKIAFEPSGFQGDPEDSDKELTPTDGTDRLHVDGVVDWIAKVHFWTPVIAFNSEGYSEEKAAAEKDLGGFLSWDQMPAGAYPQIRKRFEHGSK